MIPVSSNRYSRFFSGRSPAPAELAPNELSLAVQRRREQGLPLLDLRCSNPTQLFPAGDWLRDALDVDASSYQPCPFGLPAARACVRRYLEQSFGVALGEQSVMLCASTSEAYSLLFKLLCEPGDAILAPSPSYPLLDALCRLDGVELLEYPLYFDDGRWHIDFGALEARLHPRCRALVIIAPNNPTGSIPSADERQRLEALARTHRLALISDEVFAEFPVQPRPEAAALPFCAHSQAPLVFSLGGLSKSALLPGSKLSWMVLAGDEPLLAEARERLEYILDAYLSVSTHVQLALPKILERSSAVRAQVVGRLHENLETLHRIHHRDALWTPLPVEAGWTVLLRVPCFESDESLALRLVERGVWVFPGRFFGFGSGSSHLVLSLLTPPAEFTRGLNIIVQTISA